MKLNKKKPLLNIPSKKFIYLVMDGIAYEGAWCIGVFTSKRKAETYVSKRKEKKEKEEKNYYSTTYRYIQIIKKKIDVGDED